MAKQIKGTDIIEPKHLQEAYDQAVQLKNAYLELDKQVLKTSADLKKVVGGIKGQNVSEITAINNAYKESNKIKLSAINVTEQLRLAEDNVVKGKLRLQQATATQKKLLTEEIALENKQIGTLQKIAIESNKLRRERERLNLSTKEGTARLREINTQLDKNNVIIKKSSDLMKQQKLNIGNYGSAINKLSGFLGQLGLAFSAFTVMRDVMSTMVNFEKATASLSAITGATGAELESLKGTILSLATEMKVSVTETTKLFEIVGSQMPQLLKDADGMMKVSKSAIILSKASGDSIESSTLALASVMNQFSLGADQADRAMNVLAAGSLVGSAGITDVSEAMKNFGAVASGANISVEESVALIEVLGKFGVVGAESGTKLRGSVLKLQQANFGYASGQFEINDALEEAKLKMDSLGTAMEKDAFLQKTFGAENISTGRILLSNTALFEEYTKGVTGTSVATQQAAINSDTMSTVVKELKAAWENLVIKWSDGTGVLTGLKAVLRFVADNLETIVEVVFGAVRAWAAYIVQQKLWRFEMDKNNKLMAVGLIPNLIASTKAIFASASAFKMGTISVKAFGASLKTIPFMAIISAVSTLVGLFWDTEESVDATADNMGELKEETLGLTNVNKKLNEEMIKERAQLTGLIERLGATTFGTKERKDGLDELNKTYGVTLENIKDETEFNRQLNEVYAVLIQNIETKIRLRLVEEEINALLEKRIKLEDDLKPINDERRNRILQRQIELKQQIKDLESQTFIPGVPDQFGNVQTKADQIESLRTELAQLDLQLKGQNDIAFTVDEEGFNSIADINARIDELKGSLGQLSSFSFTKGAGAGGSGETTAKKITDLDRLESRRKEHNLEMIRYENELIAKGMDREMIDEQMVLKREQLYIDELGYIKTLSFETTEEYDKTLNALIKLDKGTIDYLDTTRELKKEVEGLDKSFDPFRDALAEAGAIKQKMDEEAAEKARELHEERKRMAEESIQLLKKITEAMIEETDKQIEKEREKLTESEQQEEYFRQLAAAGNVDAAESVKAEQIAQAQAKLEIEQLEKKKRNLLIMVTTLELASQKINSGDANATSNASSEIAELIAKIPKFIEGTETTVAKALGKPMLSGQDGYLIRADGDEMILNPEQSGKLKGLNTDQITSGALAYHSNLAGSKVMRYSQTMSDSRIVSKLEAVENAIKKIQIPEHQFNFDEQNEMAVHTIKKGDKTIRNHQKIGGLFS